jgi:hypothetical protein
MRQRKVLMIAYHFPPIRGSSGMQRTLRFAQDLPSHGWRPIVLTIHKSAYDEVAIGDGNEIPAGLVVHRAFGFNAARKLRFLGGIAKRLSLPDRWASWRRFAVRRALEIVKTEGIDVIWSTFPIATSHAIALEVASKTGLPWVADFRDPMWQADWPIEAVANKAWLELEQQVVAAASRLVFVAPSAVEMYSSRYPKIADKLVMVENGFDEESFLRAAALQTPTQTDVGNSNGTNQRLRLLHSGIIYKSERDPTQLFAAIAALKAQGKISSATLQIILRAAGEEMDFPTELRRLGIDDIVHVAPGVFYLEALAEMMTVDGLLILQASNCNAQIPAKLYEYLRAERPILALTDSAGDTARTLRAAGVGHIAKLDSTQDIEASLISFLQSLRDRNFGTAPRSVIDTYSRHSQCGKLGSLFDQLTMARLP